MIFLQRISFDYMFFKSSEIIFIIVTRLSENKLQKFINYRWQIKQSWFCMTKNIFRSVWTKILIRTSCNRTNFNLEPNFGSYYFNLDKILNQRMSIALNGISGENSRNELKSIRCLSYSRKTIHQNQYSRRLGDII